MKVLAVIPARLESSRLPRKMLCDLGGVPVIQKVWENTQSFNLFDKVIVATDSTEIEKVMATAGADVMLTSPDHPSGFDRVGEVLQAYSDYAVVVNIQGDEPFLEKHVIDTLLKLMKEKPELPIATVAVPIHDSEELENPNAVKVVLKPNHEALYFSRAPIPYHREAKLEGGPFAFKHLGLYGYRADIFSALQALSPGKLEGIEKLEQLRFLEAGYVIGVGVTESNSIGIDTEDDLLAARKRLA